MALGMFCVILFSPDWKFLTQEKPSRHLLFYRCYLRQSQGVELEKATR